MEHLLEDVFTSFTMKWFSAFSVHSLFSWNLSKHNRQQKALYRLSIILLSLLTRVTHKWRFSGINVTAAPVTFYCLITSAFLWT